MKKIFVTTVFGYANKGDWALFNSLKRTLEGIYGRISISATCKNSDIQSKYIENVEWIEQLGSSNRQDKLRYFFILLGYLKAIWLMIIYPFSKNKYVRALKNADIIVSCPGGYLHDANFSIVTLLFNYALCIRSGKKIVFAPQSIGPIENKLYRYLVKKLLQKSDLIFARENYSYKYCTDVLKLPLDKVSEVMDMAFYDRKIENPRLDIKLPEKFIAMTLIKWLYPFSKDPVYEHRRYLKEIAKFITQTTTEKNLEIVLLKQIEDFGDDMGDDLIFTELQSLLSSEILSKVHVINKFLNPENMKWIISQSEYFVGSRMHSNIFALSCNKPVIAISYQPKTEYIMKSLGLNEFSFSIEEFVSDNLYKALEKHNSYPDYFEQLNVLSEHSKSSFSDALKKL